MNTIQVILAVIMYVLLLAIIGQLIHACIYMVRDDLKRYGGELVGFTITMFGCMVVSLVVIGLLPIIHLNFNPTKYKSAEGSS